MRRMIRSLFRRVKVDPTSTLSPQMQSEIDKQFVDFMRHHAIPLNDEQARDLKDSFRWGFLAGCQYWELKDPTKGNPHV